MDIYIFYVLLENKLVQEEARIFKILIILLAPHTIFKFFIIFGWQNGSASSPPIDGSIRQNSWGKMTTIITRWTTTAHRIFHGSKVKWCGYTKANISQAVMMMLGSLFFFLFFFWNIYFIFFLLGKKKRKDTRYHDWTKRSLETSQYVNV